MKFKIYLEYCGTNYSGWQKQENAKTIQGTLEKAVREAFKKTKGQNKFMGLQASGRTDAGVHAIEQICHLECETMLAPEIMKMKINDELPSDINILELEKARKDFHARHSAKARQYLYVISKRRTALEKKYVWWVKDKLDIEKMKKACRLFGGMHDFSSFTDRSALSEDDTKSAKCKVGFIEVTDSPEKILIRIKASHFLWKMVRRIVGVLVEVGRGKLTEEDIESYLNTYSEEPAKLTAPPSGLFLEKVYY
jgi:tRNA pseudouridine38-40 synthase